MRSSSESKESSLDNRRRNRRGVKTAEGLSPTAKWEARGFGAGEKVQWVQCVLHKASMRTEFRSPASTEMLSRCVGPPEMPVLQK